MNIKEVADRVADKEDKYWQGVVFQRNKTIFGMVDILEEMATHSLSPEQFTKFSELLMEIKKRIDVE